MFKILICIFTVTHAYFNQANHWAPYNPQFYPYQRNQTPLIQIKNKILQLTDQTVKELQPQMVTVKEINDNFKLNQFYRIGYLVSYVIEKSEEMAELMKYIERNGGRWSVLKLLNAFEQIRKSKEILSQALLLLQPFKNSRQPEKREPFEGRVGDPPEPIAWSYYDDI